MTSSDRLTSGMVGVEVEFEFSEEWGELTKAAVFTAGDEKRSVLQSQWTDNRCRIPHECLAEPDRHLLVGVYGINGDGTVIIPTVYADLGIIFTGTDTEEAPGDGFTPPLWAQLHSELENKPEKSDMVLGVNGHAVSDRKSSLRRNCTGTA